MSAAALVTDGDLVGAVAGLRALAAAGVRAHVLAPTRSAPGLRSRHAASRAVGPDPGRDPAGFTSAVAAVAQRHGPVVVYPSREESLDALLAADLPSDVRLPSAGSETDRVLRDKAALPALAERAGLRTPRTVAAGPAGTVGAHAAALPVLVKPGARGPGIPEVAVAHSRSELTELLAACPPELPVILQEQLEGPLACLALVVDREGAVRARFQQQADRIFPVEAGACVTAVSVAPDEALFAASARMLRDAGHWGLAQLDFILASDGPRLIDVNPRFYISLPLATAAGVNLPAAWHAVATGAPAPAAPGGYRTGVWFRRLECDISAARQGRPGLLAARPPSPRVGAIWSRADPLPGAWLAARRIAGFRLRGRAS